MWTPGSGYSVDDFRTLVMEHATKPVTRDPGPPSMGLLLQNDSLLMGEDERGRFTVVWGWILFKEQHGTRLIGGERGSNDILEPCVIRLTEQAYPELFGEDCPFRKTAGDP